MPEVPTRVGVDKDRTFVLGYPHGGGCWAEFPSRGTKQVAQYQVWVKPRGRFPHDDDYYERPVDDEPLCPFYHDCLARAERRNAQSKDEEFFVKRLVDQAEEHDVVNRVHTPQL